MKKQKEIKTFLKDGIGNVWADGRDGKYINLDDCAESIIKYLHSQGVVIIDREKELPIPAYYFPGGKGNITDTNIVARHYRREILKAGFVAVEPIIECCPTCGKDVCKCPTINRGSFAKYVEP